MRVRKRLLYLQGFYEGGTASINLSEFVIDSVFRCMRIFLQSVGLTSIPVKKELW